MGRLVDEVKRVIEEANKNELILKRLEGKEILLEISSQEGERVLVKISGGGIEMVKPSVRVSGKQEILEKIMRGETDIMKSYLLGRIKFEGDPSNAFIIYERLKEFLKLARHR